MPILGPMILPPLKTSTFGVHTRASPVLPFTTRCFEAGIKPKTVQKYLGQALL